MPNVALRPKTNLSLFRRVAIGTWHTVGDPSVYGSLDLRVDEALRYIEAYRDATGRRVTLNHLMAKAVAAVLSEHPDANAILRFNRIYLREQVKLFFQVALEDPDTGEVDLSGVTVEDPEEKTLGEVLDVFERRVKKVKKQEGDELAQSRGMFRWIPSLLLNFVLWISGFLAYTLNLDLSSVGVPRDAFGSVMITNIGSLGLEEAYVPLVPYSRVPLLIALGSVRAMPVVEDGEIVPGRMMRVSVTFDHRILDGAHAAAMAKTVRAWMEHPFEHFDAIEDAAAAAAAAEALPAARSTARPEGGAGAEAPDATGRASAGAAGRVGADDIADETANADARVAGGGGD